MRQYAMKLHGVLVSNSVRDMVEDVERNIPSMIKRLNFYGVVDVDESDFKVVPVEVREIDG